MLSVREVAKRQLGYEGAFSVTSDLYSYPFRATDGTVFGALTAPDVLPRSGQPLMRSLGEHLQRLEGQCTNLSVILVDHEDDFSGVVTQDQVAGVQYSLQVLRDLYAQQTFGVRKIYWKKITPADGAGRASVADKVGADTLTDDFSSPEDSIDVFMVQSIGDASGWSPTTGPCDKDDDKDMSGAVVMIPWSSKHIAGIGMAHEVGHYLGLSHTGAITNVMGFDPNGTGVGNIDDTSLNISGAEGATVKGHCSVH